MTINISSKIFYKYIKFFAKDIIKKAPGVSELLGLSKNRSYLLSHLVGQYHRRW